MQSYHPSLLQNSPFDLLGALKKCSQTCCLAYIPSTYPLRTIQQIELKREHVQYLFLYIPTVSQVGLACTAFNIPLPTINYFKQNSDVPSKLLTLTFLLRYNYWEKSWSYLSYTLLTDQQLSFLKDKISFNLQVGENKTFRSNSYKYKLQESVSTQYKQQQQQQQNPQETTKKLQKILNTEYITKDKSLLKNLDKAKAKAKAKVKKDKHSTNSNQVLPLRAKTKSLSDLLISLESIVQEQFLSVAKNHAQKEHNPLNLLPTQDTDLERIRKIAIIKLCSKIEKEYQLWCQKLSKEELKNIQEWNSDQKNILWQEEEFVLWNWFWFPQVAFLSLSNSGNLYEILEKLMSRSQTFCSTKTTISEMSEEMPPKLSEMKNLFLRVNNQRPKKNTTQRQPMLNNISSIYCLGEMTGQELFPQYYIPLNNGKENQNLLLLDTLKKNENNIKSQHKKLSNVKKKINEKESSQSIQSTTKQEQEKEQEQVNLKSFVKPKSKKNNVNSFKLPKWVLSINPFAVFQFKTISQLISYLTIDSPILVPSLKEYTSDKNPTSFSFESIKSLICIQHENKNNNSNNENKNKNQDKNQNSVSSTNAAMLLYSSLNILKQRAREILKFTSLKEKNKEKSSTKCELQSNLNFLSLWIQMSVCNSTTFSFNSALSFSHSSPSSSSFSSSSLSSNPSSPSVFSSPLLFQTLWDVCLNSKKNNINLSLPFFKKDGILKNKTSIIKAINSKNFINLNSSSLSKKGTQQTKKFKNQSQSKSNFIDEKFSIPLFDSKTEMEPQQQQQQQQQKTTTMKKIQKMKKNLNFFNNKKIKDADSSVDDSGIDDVPKLEEYTNAETTVNEDVSDIVDEKDDDLEEENDEEDDQQQEDDEHDDDDDDEEKDEIETISENPKPLLKTSTSKSIKKSPEQIHSGSYSSFSSSSFSSSSSSSSSVTLLTVEDIFATYIAGLKSSTSTSSSSYLSSFNSLFDSASSIKRKYKQHRYFLDQSNSESSDFDSLSNSNGGGDGKGSSNGNGDSSSSSSSSSSSGSHSESGSETLSSLPLKLTMINPFYKSSKKTKDEDKTKETSNSPSVSLNIQRVQANTFAKNCLKQSSRFMAQKNIIYSYLKTQLQDSIAGDLETLKQLQTKLVFGDLQGSEIDQKLINYVPTLIPFELFLLGIEKTQKTLQLNLKSINKLEENLERYNIEELLKNEDIDEEIDEGTLGNALQQFQWYKTRIYNLFTDLKYGLLGLESRIGSKDLADVLARLILSFSQDSIHMFRIPYNIQIILTQIEEKEALTHALEVVSKVCGVLGLVSKSIYEELCYPPPPPLASYKLSSSMEFEKESLLTSSKKSVYNVLSGSNRKLNWKDAKQISSYKWWKKLDSVVVIPFIPDTDLLRFVYLMQGLNFFVFLTTEKSNSTLSLNPFALTIQKQFPHQVVVTGENIWTIEDLETIFYRELELAKVFPSIKQEEEDLKETVRSIIESIVTRKEISNSYSLLKLTIQSLAQRYIRAALMNTTSPWNQLSKIQKSSFLG